MKPIYILFVLPSLMACGDAVSSISRKSGDTITNELCCIPDSNMFRLKHLDRTVENTDVLLIKQLKDLTKEQITAWIDPIPAKDKYNIEASHKIFKALSFQQSAGKHYVILLMMIEDFQEEYVIGQQMLITIDKHGNYISGLPVSYLRNLSNSDVEVDSTSNLFRFSEDTRSRFINDTIKVYQLVNVGKTATPKSSSDTWEEVFETVYLIKSDGKFEMIQRRKKVGEKVK